MNLSADSMQAWAPLVGTWKTTGWILDEAGDHVATIDGTDSYRWMDGGHLLIHEADVLMGLERVVVLEVIGDHDASSNTYPMRSFDSGGGFTTMTATAQETRYWLLEGEGIRATLDPLADAMTASWERLDAGTWIPWLDMRFERLS